MVKVYIMVGLPGSGKSTYIKNHLSDIPVVSRDDIRTTLGLCGKGEKCVGTKDEEKNVTVIQDYLVRKYIEEGSNFVVDNTNLNKYRRKLVSDIRHWGKEYGKDIEIHMIVLDTNIETCIERRKGQIDDSVLNRMNEGYLPPEPFEYDDIIYPNSKPTSSVILKEIVLDAILKYGSDIFMGLLTEDDIKDIVELNYVTNFFHYMRICDRAQAPESQRNAFYNKLMEGC